MVPDRLKCLLRIAGDPLVAPGRREKMTRAALAHAARQQTQRGANDNDGGENARRMTEDAGAVAARLARLFSGAG